MELIDLFGNLSQDKAINEIQASQTKALGRNTALVQRLQEENHELRIRIGVLIRLLIERGVFSADDFAKLVNETKEKLKPAAAKPQLGRSGAGHKRPVQTPKLPSPPPQNSTNR